jgi:AcrR family transcriptional regulator
MPPRTRTTPRKNPRQERSRATVEAILEATARILVKEGYDRASTNRIALAAGVSVGSLYQYFPSKEALVAALVDHHMNRMTELLTNKAAELADAPIQVAAREVIRAMIAAHRIDPDLHRVLVEQVPRLGRLQRIEEFETHTCTMLRAWLAARRKEIRPKNVDLAAFIVAHAVEALTHGAVLHRPELLHHEGLVDEATELVVRYLSVDPDAPNQKRQ